MLGESEFLLSEDKYIISRHLRRIYEDESPEICRKEVNIDDALGYLRLLGFIYPETANTEMVYERYVNVWASFLKNKLFANFQQVP